MNEKSDVLHIAPNRPVTVALVNPEGAFDFDIGIGLYETTAGQTFKLPRPAVVILNALDPDPGEEIVITKHWSGKPGDKSEWTISLSPQAEKARAKAEGLTQEPAADPQTVDSPTQSRKEPVAPPTPIRRPSKRAPAPEIQPRLFDKGTGTHGLCPAPQVPLSIPLPAVAIGRQMKPGQIPANVAIKEILAFLKADPSTANWDAQSIQDLCSTAYIAAVKQGWVGLWERHDAE
jgi:hypothetical protein